MPETIPLVWASRWATLIGPNGVGSGSQGRYSCTGASRSIRPASCSRSSATAVIALLIDAIGSSAPGSMGRPEATSATPTASSRRHPPGPISPTANPGSASRSRANASNRPAATLSTPPSSLGSGRQSPQSEPGAWTRAHRYRGPQPGG